MRSLPKNYPRISFPFLFMHFSCKDLKYLTACVILEYALNYSLNKHTSSICSITAFSSIALSLMYDINFNRQKITATL